MSKNWKKTAVPRAQNCGYLNGACTSHQEVGSLMRVKLPIVGKLHLLRSIANRAPSGRGEPGGTVSRKGADEYGCKKTSYRIQKIRQHE